MYIGEKILYCFIYIVDGAMSVAFLSICVFLLLSAVVFLFSFISGGASIIIGVVAYVGIILLVLSCKSLYFIINRFKDPYEPYGKLEIIISELPIIEPLYKLKNIVVNDFSKKMDKLSY